MASYPSSTSLIPLAQALGVTAPAVYAAITYSYNTIVLPPILDYADDERRLAKQWLRAYQQGPVFVPPLFLLSTLSNGFLAGWNFWRYAYGQGRAATGGAATMGSDGKGDLWVLGAAVVRVLAVLAFGVIVPYTLMGMEKRINGAGKWKVQMLLAPSFSSGSTASSSTAAGSKEGSRVDAEGVEIVGKEEELKWVMKEGTRPSAFTHSAQPEWRKWAEGVSMREIVVQWGEWNAPRVYICLAAFAASAVGMCLNV